MKATTVVARHELDYAEDSLIVNNRLSPRFASASFQIIGNTWAANPSISCAPVVAIGGETSPAKRDEVTIEVSNSSYLTRMFGGYIASVKIDIDGLRRLYNCVAQDYQSRAHGILVTKSYSSQTEAQVITNLFSTYWPDVDTTTYVTGPETISSIDFTRIYLDESLDALAELNDREWYIDYNKKLHYSTPSVGAAPFNLSDQPNMSTTFPYYNMDHKDETYIGNFTNRVTVVGRDSEGDDIVVTVTDDDSYDAFKEWYDYKHVDRNINTEAWATLVGNAILEEKSYGLESGFLLTNQEGLEVGQYVNIVSRLKKVNGDFLIRSTSLHMLGATTPEVRIDYGDYSPGLIELLARIKEQANREA